MLKTLNKLKMPSMTCESTIQNKHNMTSNRTGRTQTSQWLFTSMREELNMELSETNSSKAQSQWDLSTVITKVLVLYKF